MNKKKEVYTQFELNSILLKLENIDLNITERGLLGAILSFINDKTYIAFPSTTKLISITGLSDRTIDRCRKSLISKGWMTYKGGSKQGVSNQYYINFEKIISIAIQQRISISDKSIPQCADNYSSATKKPHKRNVSGFKQNYAESDVHYCKDEPNWFYDNDKSDNKSKHQNYDDDADCPF